jgi:hypothetical protein
MIPQGGDYLDRLVARVALDVMADMLGGCTPPPYLEMRRFEAILL